MVNITEHILETKKEDFDTAYLEDRYRTVLVEKLREKQAAYTPSRNAPSAPSSQNVINLMDALRRSLGAEQPVTRSKTPAEAARRGSAAVTSSPDKRSRSKRSKSG